MKWASGDTCATGHSYNYIGVLRPTVMRFREVIYDWVESRSHKIGKLHFHHAFNTCNGKSHAYLYNTRFTNGCVAHAVFTKLLNKSSVILKTPTYSTTSWPIINK